MFDVTQWSPRFRYICCFSCDFIWFNHFPVFNQCSTLYRMFKWKTYFHSIRKCLDHSERRIVHAHFIYQKYNPFISIWSCNYIGNVFVLFCSFVCWPHICNSSIWKKYLTSNTVFIVLACVNSTQFDGCINRNILIA